jgi:hypothetical protein
VSERNHLQAEYGLRLFLVLITFALAAAVPRLDLFISLVRTFVLDPDPDWIQWGPWIIRIPDS